MGLLSDADPGEPPSDEVIIERVLDGDVEVFGELVRRYRASVYRVGLSWFHRHEEAEDLVQDVFLKAYTKLASFRGASKFSTWLLRIAYNTATSSKMRRREHEEYDGEITPDERQDVEEAAVSNEAADEVRAALSSLTPDQAVCVELCFFQEQSYMDIAKITGFPVNTIKSHVFRAKRILRERLRQGMEA